MQEKRSAPVSEARLRGLRVLGFMSLSSKDRTKHMLKFLRAAKERWSWEVSVVCADIDQKPFFPIVAPAGKTYSPPHLLVEADWEQDPAAVAAVEDKMRQAEAISGLPFGRVVLAGGHSIGRAYSSSVRHTRPYKLVRKVLTDNGEPIRIVRRLFRFVDETLAVAKPDIIYLWDVSSPLNFTAWMAATRRGIPCICLRMSKIQPDRCFWTTDRLMYNTASLAAAEVKRRTGAPVSDKAKARIDGFRNQPAVINYIASKWRHRTQRGFVRWHLEYGRTVYRELINGWRGQDRALREPAVARFYRYYRSLVMSYWHKLHLTMIDEAELAKTKYVYLPLHKEAELAQTFQATLWHDQRNTIRVVASHLPFGYRLLVREHRFNYGFRPTRYYKLINEIPNVTFIDPFDSQFKYLRHADLVLTDNGSSGWEGMLLGRRVLSLSDSFYDGAALDTKVKDPDRLGAEILRVLSEPAVTDAERHDRQLGHAIDAELETTFPLNSEDMTLALDRFAATAAPHFSEPRAAAE